SAELTRHAAGAGMNEAWQGLALADSYSVALGIDPRFITSATLTSVWAQQTLDTTVTVRLRRDEMEKRTRVSALVRYATTRPTEYPIKEGLLSLNGRHRDALLAGLPVGAVGLENLTPAGVLTPEALDALQVPASGCGQLIGSDPQGFAVAARIAGSGVNNVVVRGELYVAQQVVIRAVAVGARVVLYTDRTHAWEVMVDSVNDRSRLQFASGREYFDPHCNLMVFDGLDASERSRGATVMHVISSPDIALPSRPDVMIDQPYGYGDRVNLYTGGEVTEVKLVTIGEELAYVGRPQFANSGRHSR
ncbi:MAG: type VII secretion protein EccE, partial [Mycobacteriaceae bacterium]